MWTSICNKFSENAGSFSIHLQDLNVTLCATFKLCGKFAPPWRWLVWNAKQVLSSGGCTCMLMWIECIYSVWVTSWFTVSTFGLCHLCSGLHFSYFLIVFCHAGHVAVLKITHWSNKPQLCVNYFLVYTFPLPNRLFACRTENWTPVFIPISDGLERDVVVQLTEASVSSSYLIFSIYYIYSDKYRWLEINLFIVLKMYIV